MNWLTSKIPGLRFFSHSRKKDIPEKLWVACPKCSNSIFSRNLGELLHVCPNCGHHMRMRAGKRFEQLFDQGSWELLPQPKVSRDPLKFRDRKKYEDRLKEASKNGEDSILAGEGKIMGHEVILVVQDFFFMGGSMGLAAGEAFFQACVRASEKRMPLVVVTASGGMRMQEGALSLMQMPKSVVGLRILAEAALPYIVVLSDPTTGGVTASFAMLGDVTIAEVGALVGFAGSRVVEQTMLQKLPPGFQRAKFLKECGMVDLIAKRSDLPKVLAQVIDLLMNKQKAVEAVS